MNFRIAARRGLCVLILLCMGAIGAIAQARSSTGQLQVTATVVSSSRLVEQPDGSMRLIVANAPSQADERDIQQAIAQLSEKQVPAETVPPAEKLQPSRARQSHK